MCAHTDALTRLSMELGNSPWLSVAFLLRDRATRPQVDAFQSEQYRRDAIAVANFIAGVD